MKIILSYKRDDGHLTSSGSISVEKDGGAEAFGLSHVTFDKMIARLSEVLRKNPTDIAVFLERTDRDGLLPYKLDAQTVTLIREDPIAAVNALTYTTASPSTAERRAKKRDVPIMPAPVSIGFDVLAEAFGDDLYFRVKDNTLECPGCGFWSPFTMKGMLEDEEREGRTMHTIFVCQKKCKGRFRVRCWKKWGSVSAEYLLVDTAFDVFYFPRPWNGGRSWIGRQELQQKFDEYQKEK